MSICRKNCKFTSTITKKRLICEQN
uniref:Uncharacterized protein n=1 Tax=Romanomermis culicivorax TaxID=13658 RepID=A0A915I1B5_ROMCU